MKCKIALLSVLLVLNCSFAKGLPPQEKASIPESFYKEMQSKIEGGGAPTAIPALQESLTTHSTDVRLHNLLGLAYTATKQLDAGDSEFSAAIALDSSYIPALRNLAINEESLGHHRQSVEHFERVLSLHPRDPIADVYLGSDRFLRQDYGRAYDLLSDVGSLDRNPTITMERSVSKIAVEAKPIRAADQEAIGSLQLSVIAPQLLVVGGTALAVAGDYADGIRFFRQLPPEWQALPDVTYNLALCLIQSHHTADAVHVLGSYLDAKQHTGALLSLAAEAYAANGETQKAINSLREAISLEPEVEDYYIDLAEICTQYDAYDVGIKVLSVGIHAMPASDRLFFERGVLEAMKNDSTSADRDFERAQDLAPTKSLAGLAIGVGMMQAGQLPEAIRELRSKAKTDPKNAVLQYMLAEAILQSGASSQSSDLVEARSALERAAKADPSYEPPLVALARLQIQDRRFEDAHVLLTRAVSLAPQDASALSQLVIVDHRLGREDEVATAVAHLSQINQRQRDERHRSQIHIGASQ